MLIALGTFLHRRRLGLSRCRQILGELLRPIGPERRRLGRPADRRIRLARRGACRAAGRPATGPRRGSKGAFPGSPPCAPRCSTRCGARRWRGPCSAMLNALIDYLFAAMAHEPVEQLRVLYLNTRNRLLLDETVIEGSINVTPIYPREIVKRSLEVGRDRAHPRPQSSVRRSHAEPRGCPRHADGRRGRRGARHQTPRPRDRRPFGLDQSPRSRISMMHQTSTIDYRPAAADADTAADRCARHRPQRRGPALCRAPAP